MIARVAFITLLILADTTRAAEPVVGGWRNLMIDPEFDVSQKNSPFIMLSGDVAMGTRFRVMDLKRWQAVCCLEVASPQLGRDTLIHSYRVPSVWVTDLKAALDDKVDGQSHVFAARSVDCLAHHVFEGDFESNGEMGGLMLPADATAVAPDKVVMGGKTYRVKKTEGSLADDDGGWEEYTMTPEHGGASVTIDVRYGTN